METENLGMFGIGRAIQAFDGPDSDGPDFDGPDSDMEPYIVLQIGKATHATNKTVAYCS